MKITSKGQVTIPLAIRQRAGLLPQTRPVAVGATMIKSLSLLTRKETA